MEIGPNGMWSRSAGIGPSGEQLRVEALHRFSDVGVVDQQADVDVVGAVRNHLDVYPCIAQSTEYAGAQAGLILGVAPDDADDRLLFGDGDTPMLRQGFNHFV